MKIQFNNKIKTKISNNEQEVHETQNLVSERVDAG